MRNKFTNLSVTIQEKNDIFLFLLCKYIKLHSQPASAKLQYSFVELILGVSKLRCCLGLELFFSVLLILSEKLCKFFGQYLKSLFSNSFVFFGRIRIVIIGYSSIIYTFIFREYKIGPSRAAIGVVTYRAWYISSIIGSYNR